MQEMGPPLSGWIAKNHEPNSLMKLRWSWPFYFKILYFDIIKMVYILAIGGKSGGDCG